MTFRIYALYHELATLLKKNSTIGSLSRIAATPLFKYWMWREKRDMLKRRNGYIDPRFTWVKDLKGKYQGKRCFVIGNGPSLTFSDLDLISEEYSFGVNACVLAFDKTKWRPTFYGVQDEYVYEQCEDYLVNHPELNVFMAEDIAKMFDIPEWFKIFPSSSLDSKLYRSKGFMQIKFSDDVYETVYKGASIIFAMMQFAVYMGFKEMYLLGCDCNYGLAKQHFVEYSHRNKILPNEGEKVLYAHGEFKKFADSHGVKVVNCTRGGKLEVYPRMALEDVLAH